MRNATNWATFMGCAALGLSITLAGCESIRDATGSNKLAPDEFSVVNKAPLIVPPDFNLRPPQPGAADRNSLTPTDEAQEALFPVQTQTATDTLGPGYSSGEKTLLTSAGATNTDPKIRQSLSDEGGYADRGAPFTQKVLNAPATAQ